jgi:hypothetical protein
VCAGTTASTRQPVSDAGLPSACQGRLHELGGAVRSEPVAAAPQVSCEDIFGPEGLDPGEAKTSELYGECAGSKDVSQGSPPAATYAAKLDRAARAGSDNEASGTTYEKTISLPRANDAT